jgi:cytochrome o ubiquinol oxidase subunit 1
VYDNDTWADMKKNKYARPLKDFVAIHMPKNTWAGFGIAALSFVLAFGIIWHMWLLVGASFVAMIAATIYHTFDYKRDYYIPAEEVTRTEDARTRMLEAHV